MNIREEFRKYLNEASASAVKKRELAARDRKVSKDEMKQSEKDAIKVKIDKMFKLIYLKI